MGRSHPAGGAYVNPALLRPEDLRYGRLRPPSRLLMNSLRSALTALLTGLPDPMIRAKASCEQDCPTTAKSRETTHTQNCGYFPGTSSSSPYTGSELPTKLLTPAPHRFVAEHHPAGSHHLFHIAEAHSKTEVQPNAPGNDLFRKPMTSVQAASHSFSIPSAVHRLM
jgi:hypothetical protein